MTDNQKDTVKAVFYTDIEVLLKVCKASDYTTLQSLAHIAEHVSKSEIEFLFWLARSSYFELFTKVNPDKFMIVIENYYPSWEILKNIKE